MRYLGLAWLFALLVALVGCGRPEPEPVADETVSQAPAADYVTPEEAPDAVAPAEAVEPAVDAEEDPATLPTLEAIPDPGQRYLETARRALLGARAALAERQFALATEDLDAAAAALKAARPVVDETAGAVVDELLARFEQELPGTPAAVTEILQQVTAARGPLVAASAEADALP